MLALTMSETTYFVERQGLLKIGKASHLPTRIRDINRGSGAIPGMTITPVNILATMPGGRPVEKALHELFDFLRHGGEWFRYEEPLVTFVESIAAAKKRTIAEPMELSLILGEVEARPDRVDADKTLLHHLRLIMDARETAWSSDLVLDLAKRWPDRYAGWSPTDLATRLRPFGVKTRQVWRRVDGRGCNRNGLRLRDLLEAS